VHPVTARKRWRRSTCSSERRGRVGIRLS
jgi:hypothetical protein